MNLFQQYGIKEVADVTFFSITEIGDEEFYTPVLHIDTAKIFSTSQNAATSSSNGGYGDQKVISWSCSKDINLQIEDALFSQASMNLTYGWLKSKLSLYSSTIAKINLANKYGLLNYSVFAFPSPPLSEEEWELVFFILGTNFHTSESLSDLGFNLGIKNITFSGLTKEFINYPYVAEIRKVIKETYYTREKYFVNEQRAAMPRKVIELIFDQIQYVEQLGEIKTENYKLEVIDRFEKCVVKNEEGFAINIKEQRENLFKYYTNDTTTSYNIYYDIKTMLPFFKEDIDGRHRLRESNSKEVFKLKKGTVYYKWSRTVKPTIDDTKILGKTLVINANTFPEKLRIVGETYIRERHTQTDRRYQFVINRAMISNETNLELSADGDPAVFSMSVDVLAPPNEIMMELREFNVESDMECGGTKILPQSEHYSYTPVDIDIKKEKIENSEIY